MTLSLLHLVRGPVLHMQNNYPLGWPWEAQSSPRAKLCSQWSLVKEELHQNGPEEVPDLSW